ncbi:MAG: addiction module protein [Phycisphaerae bacterium]|nr:addiction module protein [Phycisphaerae bacterium]
MVAKNLLDSVCALSIEDRLELLDRLTESIRNDPSRSALSVEHQKILDQRLDELALDPAAGSPWDDVEQRILSNLARHDAHPGRPTRRGSRPECRCDLVCRRVSDCWQGGVG